MKSFFPSLSFLLIACPVFTQSSQDLFWDALQDLCGKAYTGSIMSAPENDTVFSGREIVMHVRTCESDRIRIPLVVGDDYSRTWILTRHAEGFTLKHDHRHKDGTEDRVTRYGGSTTNDGSAVLQVFPADQYTAGLLPPAATNVWWIEIVPASHLIYNLRRLGTERYFSIRFDLTREVQAPGAPWGWSE